MTLQLSSISEISFNLCSISFPIYSFLKRKIYPKEGNISEFLNEYFFASEHMHAFCLSCLFLSLPFSLPHSFPLSLPFSQTHTHTHREILFKVLGFDGVF